MNDDALKGVDKKMFEHEKQHRRGLYCQKQGIHVCSWPKCEIQQNIKERYCFKRRVTEVIELGKKEVLRGVLRHISSGWKRESHSI